MLILAVSLKVEEMAPFAPQLQFVDSHSRGDRKNGFSFELKPDICIYQRSPDSPNRCDVSTLDLFVEFKWYNFDDPFTVPQESDSRETTPCVRWSQSRIDTIGQMGAYVAAQLAAQFRTHAFSIFVAHRSARIIRWDREGAIVTEPIPFAFDPSLVEFFSRYSQAPPELRGIDVTVTKALGDEAARAREILGLKSDVPMFKTSVQTTQDSGSSTVVFAQPPCKPTLPIGRATRACPAYEVSGDRLVFFKDSWRLAIDDIIPEGIIYAALEKNGVSFVPKCLASGDVECWDEQRNQTLRLSQSPWACREGMDILAHSHYRLVLDIVGASLTDFSSSKELVQAIHDALLGGSPVAYD
jgi:Fungal protein kinase